MRLLHVRTPAARPLTRSPPRAAAAPAHLASVAYLPHFPHLPHTTLTVILQHPLLLRPDRAAARLLPRIAATAAAVGAPRIVTGPLALAQRRRLASRTFMLVLLCNVLKRDA